MARILIIDDDSASLLMMQHALKNAGHEVFPLMRATRLQEELCSVRPDLVITDIIMPGISGGAVYAGVRATFGLILPVIISSSTRLHVAKGAQEDRLLEYCPKPVDLNNLVKVVQGLLDKASALRSEMRDKPRS